MLLILDTQKLILLKLEGISRRLDDLTTEIREMKASSNVPIGVIEDLPELPATNIDDLYSFESFAKESASNAFKLVL